MICFSLQCTNRQSPFHLLLTNLHVFAAACSVPFSFCVIPHLSYVFSISPASCPLGSRCPVFCFFPVSPHLGRSLALLSPLPPMLTKPLDPQCFPSFPSPEVYATILLLYLISRLVLDLFSSLAPPQRSAVFSLTPLC